MRNKPVFLFVLWATTILFSLVLPQLFPPAEGVDLAPKAGLAFLACVFTAFLIAFYLFGHTFKRRWEYSRNMFLLGISPFIISMTLIIVGIYWIIMAIK